MTLVISIKCVTTLGGSFKAGVKTVKNWPCCLPQCCGQHNSCRPLEQEEGLGMGWKPMWLKPQPTAPAWPPAWLRAGPSFPSMDALSQSARPS
jgi:hypothetical protein